MSILPFSFLNTAPPLTVPPRPSCVPKQPESKSSEPAKPNRDDQQSEPVKSDPSTSLLSPKKNLFEISTTTSQKRYHAFKHKYRTIDLNAIYTELDGLIENTVSCNSITYTHPDPVHCFAALKWIIENGYVVHFWGKKQDKYVLVFGLFYEI